MEYTWVPLFGIAFFFGSIVAIVALGIRLKARKIEHEEVMKALELGQQLPTLEVRQKYNYLNDLRNGIILAGTGLGIIALGQTTNSDIAGVGAIPAFIGAGLIVMAFLVKSFSDKENGNGGK